MLNVFSDYGRILLSLMKAGLGLSFTQISFAAQLQCVIILTTNFDVNMA